MLCQSVHTLRKTFRPTVPHMKKFDGSGFLKNSAALWPLLYLTPSGITHQESNGCYGNVLLMMLQTICRTTSLLNWVHHLPVSFVDFFSELLDQPSLTSLLQNAFTNPATLMIIPMTVQNAHRETKIKIASHSSSPN